MDFQAPTRVFCDVLSPSIVDAACNGFNHQLPQQERLQKLNTFEISPSSKADIIANLLQLLTTSIPPTEKRMPFQEVGPQDDALLQATANLLIKSRKIVVITGAGISTSCGIPDFRSKDGLYKLIPEDKMLSSQTLPTLDTSSKKRKAFTDDDILPSSQSSTKSAGSGRRIIAPSSKLKGQDLFNASVWKNTATTSTFYKFIASLRQKIRSEVNETSLTHKFIRALRDGGRLLRCYTQNVDGLESREGLSMDLAHGSGSKRRFMKKFSKMPRPDQCLKTDFDGGCEVVPLHGDLEKLRCGLCHTTCDWHDDATEIFLNGSAPECDACNAKNDARKARGKRVVSVGSLRPNVVLYGEQHPSDELLSPFVPSDIAAKPEVLIIMGTSLKVFGLQKIVKDFAKEVHTRNDSKSRVLFVNRTKPAESVWDTVIDDYIAMDCDDWVQDLERRCAELWLKQGDAEGTAKTAQTGSKRKRQPTTTVDAPSKRTKIAKPRNVQTMICVDVPPRQLTRPSHNYAVKTFTSVLADITNQFVAMPSSKSRTLSDLQKVSLPENRNAMPLAPSTPPRSKTWKASLLVLASLNSTSSTSSTMSPIRPPPSPFSESSGSPAFGGKHRPSLISESSESPDSLHSIPF